MEPSPLPNGTVRFPPEVIRDLLSAAFLAAGIPGPHAHLTAEVLVNADLRGIRSHGAARLPFFMVRLERGHINKNPRMTLRAGSDTTSVLDADNGLGTVAADRAMKEALACAEKHGAGFVAVRNSSHFGYAGFWARRAMERGSIGISMSNGGAHVAPTFGTAPIFGTNPMSVAIPGGPGGTDFHLDMATAAVAVGKIETALREGRKIPEGWISSAHGPPCLDERGILSPGVAMLPLGGEGDETGGHKGYGISLMVELFCSLLSGSELEDRIAGAEGEAPAATGHFMGALKVAGFREPARVFDHMARTFEIIRDSEKASSHERIYIHGEPEAIAEEENRRLGIPITPPVLDQLRRLNEKHALGFEL